MGARGEVHIQVSDRKEEDYVPPPKTFKAFTGSGRQLGSPTPAIKGQQQQQSQAATSAPAPNPASGMQLDPSQPHTSIQIRLADGTRLIAKLNHTHTVGDIRNFVRRYPVWQVFMLACARIWFRALRARACNTDLAFRACLMFRLHSTPACFPPCRLVQLAAWAGRLRADDSIPQQGARRCVGAVCKQASMHACMRFLAMYCADLIVVSTLRTPSHTTCARLVCVARGLQIITTLRTPSHPLHADTGTDDNATVAEAGLLNAVVLQKPK